MMFKCYVVPLPGCVTNVCETHRQESFIGVALSLSSFIDVFTQVGYPISK